MASMCFYDIEEIEKEAITRALKRGNTLTFTDKVLTQETAVLAKNAEVVGVFVHSAVSRDVLDKLPSLKLLVTLSTGYDHIDLSACKERNITVCNVPTYGENTVAEHTFALLLALSRRIVDSVDRTRKGNFSLEGLRGFDLKGKTMGIIGGGHIGMHVARIAKGFEMKVLVSDIHQDAMFARKYKFTYADLDTLLQTSDIVSLHIPYMPSTHHLLNRERFAKMKKGAILINTARGGLIDTDALVEALNNGTLAGAGLDVIEEEAAICEEKELVHHGFAGHVNLKTLLQDHILLAQPNVLITPHNAFNSPEAIMRIITATIGNIKSFLKGKPENVVAK